MKKLLCLMLLCATVFGITSCVKGDPNSDFDSTELIGKWGASVPYENNQTIYTYITFNDNGTGATEAKIVASNDSVISEATESFTYSLQGNIMTFKDKLGSRKFIVSISGDVLTLTNKAFGTKEVYTRVN